MEICRLRDEKAEEVAELEQVKREARAVFSGHKKNVQKVVEVLDAKKAALAEAKAQLDDRKARQHELKRELEQQQEKLGSYKQDVARLIDGVGGGMKEMKALSQSANEGDAHVLAEQLAAAMQKFQQARALALLRVKNDETKAAHRAVVEEADSAHVAVNTLTGEVRAEEESRARMFRELEENKARVQQADAALQEKLVVKEDLDRKIKESEIAMEKIITSSSMLLNVIAQDRHKLAKSMPPVADPAKSKTRVAQQQAAAALRASGSPAGRPKKRSIDGASSTSSLPSLH